MKVNTKQKKEYIKCVRCKSVAITNVDMGLMGKLWLCAVCWIGLAGGMARDFEIYKNFKLDYVQELQKGYQREDWFKKNNLISTKNKKK